MSAYMVDNQLLHAILTKAIQLNTGLPKDILPPHVLAQDTATTLGQILLVTHDTATPLGRILLAENARAVAHRYPNDDHSAAKGQASSYFYSRHGLTDSLAAAARNLHILDSQCSECPP